MTEEQIKLANSLRLKIKRKKNAEVIDVINKLGVDIMIHDIGTPLNVACIFGNWEIAEFCIEKGANIHHKDVYTDSPLITCCKQGCMEIVKLLIEKGAEINVKNKFDKTPIARAISDHPTHFELIEYLLKNGANPYIIEQYNKNDSRVKIHTAYDYAVSELKDDNLIALLDKYKK